MSVRARSIPVRNPTSVTNFRLPSLTDLTQGHTTGSQRQADFPLSTSIHCTGSSRARDGGGRRGWGGGGRDEWDGGRGVGRDRGQSPHPLM